MTAYERFQQIHSLEGLQALDVAFLQALQEFSPEDAAAYVYHRTQTLPLPPTHLIAIATFLDRFLITFFAIDREAVNLKTTYQKRAVLSDFQQRFLRRIVIPALKKGEITPEENVLSSEVPHPSINPLAFAAYALNALEASQDLTAIVAYCAWVLCTSEGQAKMGKHPLFALPEAIDLQHLLAHPTPEFREDFDLYDKGGSIDQALLEAGNCLKCHRTQKDSCRTGLKDRLSQAFRSPFPETPLTGCPLDQKISEMLCLMERGHPLGAFATVLIDNPLAALTGHRICNACSKACIFQHQTPINVPLAESRLVHDVLHLPWGLEIYDLLLRWNPLKTEQPLCAPFSGYHILVAGLGPAGMAMSYEMLQRGHKVTAIDAAKFSPATLPYVTKPLRDIRSLYRPLSKRQATGFGGVASYGITARWNKNYLDVLYLLFKRRSHFQSVGSIRFGGMLNIATAFQQGFDHIALCLGAGLPQLLHQPETLLKGVRVATDFLMTLHQTDITQQNTISNYVVRLPIVVLGGGLTAIDTATEAMVYYPLQVALFLDRYEKLVTLLGKDTVEQEWSSLDHEIAQEFLRHARALKKADTPAKRVALLQEWGGVHLLYRRSIQEAPSYRQNHQEIQNMLNQGIFLSTEETLHTLIPDSHGWIQKIITHSTAGEQKKRSVRTLFLALGTKPQTTLAAEAGEGITLKRQGDFFAFSNDFTVYTHPDGRSVSALGDLNPAYAGSVVKALASAKHAASQVHKTFQHLTPQGKTISPDLFEPTCIVDKHQTPERTTLFIHAPLHAAMHQEGHFYKLQNNAHTSNPENNASFLMEGVALAPVFVDKQQGIFQFDIFPAGGSSFVAQSLKIGEAVSLLGPCGAALAGGPTLNVSIQCCLKGVCGQCIAWDAPQAKIIYGCTTSKAPSNLCSTTHRLEMNSVQEKLTNLWVRYGGRVNTS